VDRAIQPAFVVALEQRGAAVLRPDEVGRVVDAVFDPVEGHVRGDLTGQPAALIAEVAGIRRAGAIRLIVVPANIDLAGGPLGREKLAPIVSLFTVHDDDQGFALCRQLLANEGAGHTAIIHTTNEQRITRFGCEMPASRILVNVPGAQGSKHHG
jgi:acetaldehyde dehydrogenase/alcohol dehydrogenase